jgi:hypothetical protein
MKKQRMSARIRDPRKSKAKLKKLLARMKGRSPYGEIDIGPRVGREII